MRGLPVLLLLLPVIPLSGQRIVVRPWAAEARRVPSLKNAPPLLSGAPDHMWGGVAVGAGIGGFMGASLAYGICSQGDNGHPSNFGYCFPHSWVGALLGGVLGATVGGLIGSGIPRTPDASPSP